MVTEKNVQPTKTFTEIARFDLKNILGIGPCLIFFHFIYVGPIILSNPGLIQLTTIGFAA